MTRSASGHDLTPLSTTDAEWRERLSPEAWTVTRQGGTERAFSGALWNEKRPGTYVSVCGGLPLFSSDDKFDSGTGWPSFTRPIDPEHVTEHVDHSHGMTRIEIRDARSGAHLGHLFDDGPPPTGKRYCVNSAALRFLPANAELPDQSAADNAPRDRDSGAGGA